MSAVLATVEPRRIKASHRRRRKVTAGHFVQRYYDPTIGRFLSTDPMPADPNSGANFNSYRYANNNPYRFTDPDGRQTAKTHEGETAEERAAALAERARRESEGRLGGGGVAASAGMTASTPPDPNSLPGGNGPYESKPGGKAGEFQGPKGEKGVRSLRTWVPPDAQSGSKGYWKEKLSNAKGWERFSPSGQPLTPEQAHPGNTNTGARDFMLTTTGRAILVVYLLTYSSDLNSGENQRVDQLRDQANCSDQACP